jgi:anti-sigma factor RsiW
VADKRVEQESDEHLGDDVVELVLGTVDGDRRARMAAHVLRCATCRNQYDELAATVEDLLPAVPGAQPPIGFDERVLARLGAAGRRPTARRRRTWLVATAAAVLVALMVPIGIWLASRDTDDVTAGAVATLHLARDGRAVGTVSVGEVEGSQVMVVALVGAPSDVSYYCRINFADGTSLDSESWPAGNGAWIVPLDPDGPAVASVEVLPKGTEKIWSAAVFT